MPGQALALLPRRFATAGAIRSDRAAQLDFGMPHSRPMPRLAPSSPATTVSTLVRLLRRGAVIAAFCVGVAALLTAMDPHTRFLGALLYSLLIR